VKEGLQSASGFLRGRLGREVKMHHVPQLRFLHDDSAAEAQRFSALIDQARDHDEQQ
jgi:ribosome-binding factor A